MKNLNFLATAIFSVLVSMSLLSGASLARSSQAATEKTDPARAAQVERNAVGIRGQQQAYTVSADAGASNAGSNQYPNSGSSGADSSSGSSASGTSGSDTSSGAAGNRLDRSFLTVPAITNPENIGATSGSSSAGSSASGSSAYGSSYGSAYGDQRMARTGALWDNALSTGATDPMSNPNPFR